MARKKCLKNGRGLKRTARHVGNKKYIVDNFVILLTPDACAEIFLFK